MLPGGDELCTVTLRLTQGRPDERSRARGVPARGDDDHLVGAEPSRGLGHLRGVLPRVSGRRVGDEGHLGAVPRCAHQLGLARAVPVPGPAGEENRVAVGGELLGVPQALGADVVQAVVAAAGVAEDRDEAHAQRRRQRSSASSVPTIVSTTMTAFLPRSLDSPPARGRMSTGTSSTRRPSSSSLSRA